MDYDVIVIGGGHAGIEAGCCLSKLNIKTLLITQNIDSIGRLSCNPAIGGLAKGNIVREIDALGGVMGSLADLSMIQFRLLNKSKGPSVRAPRVQADKILYENNAKKLLESHKNLYLLQDTVIDLITKNNEIFGVITEIGQQISSKKVILTTGTFLNGKVFIGDFSKKSGRMGEPSSYGLDKTLSFLGHSIQRLKTGTPARIHKDSIDFSFLEEQFGDSQIEPFSFYQKEIKRPNLSCYIAYTNENTHKIIRENISKSPLYSGKIIGNGPRYCPSIEDKIVKFPHHLRHQIFLEPEGIDTKEMYLNGLSTSLDFETQQKFIHSIDGLNEAHIVKYGYAVEYDAINPNELYPSLESKFAKNLFIAGQTNGTSGYEEAACQGLIAGINCFNSISNLTPFVLQRSDSYIGVLIDDLVTIGTDEPYRMFTSRAEHRICLRYDNCDKRLSQKAYDLGLLSEERYQMFLKNQADLESVKELLRQRKVLKNDNLQIDAKYLGYSFYQLLKMPQMNFEKIIFEKNEFEKFDKSTLKEAEIDIKYEGYIKRQQEKILSFKKMESIKIPYFVDYKKIFGLSNESREKLEKIKPVSVGQASRINGVRQSDVAILLMEVGRKTKNHEILDNSKLDEV